MLRIAKSRTSRWKKSCQVGFGLIISIQPNANSQFAGSWNSRCKCPGNMRREFRAFTAQVCREYRRTSRQRKVQRQARIFNCLGNFADKCAPSQFEASLKPAPCGYPDSVIITSSYCAQNYSMARQHVGPHYGQPAQSSERGRYAQGPCQIALKRQQITATAQRPGGLAASTTTFQQLPAGTFHCAVVAYPAE